MRSAQTFPCERVSYLQNFVWITKCWVTLPNGFPQFPYGDGRSIDCYCLVFCCLSVCLDSVVYGVSSLYRLRRMNNTGFIPRGNTVTERVNKQDFLQGSEIEKKRVPPNRQVVQNKNASGPSQVASGPCTEKNSHRRRLINEQFKYFTSTGADASQAL